LKFLVQDILQFVSHLDHYHQSNSRGRLINARAFTILMNREFDEAKSRANHDQPRELKQSMESILAKVDW
jgi:hypothetical protein